MLVDADGEETDDVFVDRGLTLEFGHGRAGRVDREHHEVRLAVLRDTICELLETPGLGTNDRTFIVLDDLRRALRQGIDLRLGEILTREEDMLVMSHVVFLTLADR